MSLGDVCNHRRVLHGLVGAVLCVLALGSSASIAQAAGDAMPPSTPQHLRIVRTTETKIKVAWAAATDNVAVHHYDVYRDGYLKGAVSASSTLTFVDANLWPQSTHTYYVVAVDASSNRSRASAVVTGWTIPDVVPPSAPRNLVGKFQASTESVALSWGASTDNVAVVRYDILRNLTKVGSTLGATSFTDRTAPANSRVSYIVVAVDGFANNSLPSNSVVLVTDTQRPTTPSSVRVTAVGFTSVSLAWTPSTDNFGVSKYHVYRNGIRIATQSWTIGTTFYNGGLAKSQTYTYAVVAEDTSGNLSLTSTSVGARTLS